MNLLENLGIKVIEQKRNKVVLEMSIEDKHLQPHKIMHGGVNAVLAETAASIGANLNINEDGYAAVGVDIMTHHLNPIKQGIVVTEATPVRIGNTIQTWQACTHLKDSAINDSLSTITLKKVKLANQ